MPTFASSATLGLTLGLLGLPLLGGPAPTGPEFGLSLKLQHPMGEYKSTVSDASLGYGVGLRGHLFFSPRHALSARLDHDRFQEASSEATGSNYYMHGSTKVSETSLGLTYEWFYAGRGTGGYVLAGPVYRRWQEQRSLAYDQVRPGPIPPSQFSDTTPTGLGIDLGWGYRGSAQTVIEVHMLSSSYGSTGVTANSLQFTFIQYW